MQVFHNGQFLPAAEAKIGVTEPGVLYGEGCFETLGLHAGQPRFFAQHWSRLTKAAEALSLPLPLDKAAAKHALIELAARNSVTRGVGRISLHQTVAGADLLIQATPPRRPDLPASFRVMISDYPHPGPSPLSAIKHNNYALFLAAHREARAQGFDECLLANRDGRLIEGAVSNLFWVDEHRNLATPPLSAGALPGVIRGMIQALFPAIVERAPTREQLSRSPEVFLTNSLWEIMPVRELGSAPPLPPCPGPITSRVQNGLREAHPLPTD